MSETKARGGYAKLLKSLLPEKGGRRPVYVVNGPPGAGKTTYVRERILPGDMVIDLDYICAALAGTDNPHGEHEAILSVGLDVRDALLQMIERDEGKWNRAYVISAGDKNNAQELADRLHGELIDISPTKEKCMEQIAGDVSREGRRERYITLAEQWYERNGG